MKKKLTSRKFWAMVVCFSATMLAVFGVEDLTAEQVAALLSAAFVVIAYIFGEGCVDVAREKHKKDN